MVIVTRSIDVKALKAKLLKYDYVAEDTDAETFIKNPKNVVLRIHRDGGSDYAMFESFDDSGSYGVHILFESRGAEARNNFLTMAHDMYVFYGANFLFCAVPELHKKAVVFIKKMLKAKETIPRYVNDEGDVIVTMSMDKATFFRLHNNLF